jgi:FG-GAP-like repeat/PKD-like domain
MNRLILRPVSRTLFLLVFCVTGLMFAASGLFVRPTTAGSSSIVHAAGRGGPGFNLRDSVDVVSAYSGSGEITGALRTGLAHPVSLATADFDFDGAQDLVAGYSTASGGILTVQRGDIDALAPKQRKVLRAIRKNRSYPNPFHKDASTFALPEAPDFLGTGDFDRDGHTDVVAGARGGNHLYLLSGDGHGGFSAPRAIALAGAVTSMASGDINHLDGAADLIVGTTGSMGPQLLVYQTDARSSLFSRAPAAYPLDIEATSLALGRLDDDPLVDLAVLAGGEVLVFHGQGSFSAADDRGRRLQPQFERISLPFSARALAIGDFIADRGSRTEIAVLSEDGSVNLISRGRADTRPFSRAEMLQLRRDRAELRRAGKNPGLASAVGERLPWNVAVTISNAATSATGSSRAFLIGAHVSNSPVDDLIVLDPSSRQLRMLVSENQSRSAIALDAESEFVAVASMRLCVDGRPGLVVLSKNQAAPSFLIPLAAEIITVNTAADTTAVDPSISALDAGGNISLRSAIQRSNANPGADTIMFAPALDGTPITLTLSGNDNDSLVGDLDINDSVSIVGNGPSNTLVQAGTNNTNGIDKVFGIDQNGIGGLSVGISGLTIRFGRNSVVPVGDFTETGGGLDFFDVGTSTLSLINCVITDNTDVHSYGGGINIDAFGGGGPVNITGCTISNNRTLSSDPGEVSSGGGINLFGDTQSETITNCAVTGNSIDGQWEGGGLFIRHSFGGSIQIHNSEISGNSAGSRGGGVSVSGLGVQAVTIDQKSVISSNTSGTNLNGVAGGGGLYVAQSGTASTVLSKVTITGNSLSATASSQEGGGGIGIGDIGTPVDPNVTISFSRIVGNTAASGPGLRKVNGGTVAAQDNWWGCNTDPSASPCSSITVVPPSAVNFTPWLTLTHTASPASICGGESSDLTASFLKDSDNGDVAAADIDVLIGLPISFTNAVLGTISNAQTEIQTDGTATATFTSTGSGGAGSADAVVDGAVATAMITINSPAAAITPNPSPVCAGSTGNQASAPGGADTYVWTLANGTITNGQGTPTITYTAGASGSVTLGLTVTSAGCMATDSIMVPIQPSPSATITPNPASVCPNSTGNQASAPAGATTYSWTIANGTITSATNIQTITYTAGAAGSVTLSVTVTNEFGCSASDSVEVPIGGASLTALGPASVWVGLKNSDDVGTKFDLLAEVFRNGVPVGSGQINDVPGGSSGFNNAVLSTISLSLSGTEGFCGGDTLSFRLSVRIAASSGHVNGTARLWYNDAAADSRFAATIGTANNYYLLTNFNLGTSPGPGPKGKIDVTVNRNVGGNPFVPFGTWTIATP